MLIYADKRYTLCDILLTILNSINIKSIQKHFCRLQFKMPGILSFNTLINENVYALCVIWSQSAKFQQVHLVI